MEETTDVTPDTPPARERRSDVACSDATASLQQVVEALNQGETPDQIIIRMNQRGLLAWREDAFEQDTHDVFQVRLDNQHEARFLCRYVTLPLH